MAKREILLTVSVTFDDKVTDADSVATALDTLLETALSTPGILEEYGAVDVGEFLVAQDPAVFIPV